MYNTREIVVQCQKLVRSAFQVHMRQKLSSIQGQVLTAGLLKNKTEVQSLIANDDGYAVYKDVRSTPAYWKAQCKKIVSMIRQEGAATFFITLSAAKARWSDLLVILYKLVNNQDISEEEVMKLSPEDRAKLVGKDPVTCMRHFNHRFQTCLKLLLKPRNGVFFPNEMEDFYTRIEYQMRGSPHSHGLYWIRDAPRYI